jgi:hypothetical protein
MSDLLDNFIGLMIVIFIFGVILFGIAAVIWFLVRVARFAWTGT